MITKVKTFDNKGITEQDCNEFLKNLDNTDGTSVLSITPVTGKDGNIAYAVVYVIDK